MRYDRDGQVTCLSCRRVVDAVTNPDTGRVVSRHLNPMPGRGLCGYSMHTAEAARLPN